MTPTPEELAAVAQEATDRPRLQAEAVRSKLEAVVARFAALRVEHPDHIHGLFAELYLCETASWLDHLATAPNPEPAYRTIPHFFRLYREHVLDRLDRPLAEIAPHWRAYHRLSRRLTMRSPISSHLLLISLGARAHTRYDLGCAIHASIAAGDDPPDALFGALSDDAFVRATHMFVDLHHGRQRGWRRLILRLYRAGLAVLKPIWLREFQRWRAASYRDQQPVGPMPHPHAQEVTS